MKGEVGGRTQVGLLVRREELELVVRLSDESGGVEVVDGVAGMSTAADARIAVSRWEARRREAILDPGNILIFTEKKQICVGIDRAFYGDHGICLLLARLAEYLPLRRVRARLRLGQALQARENGSNNHMQS